MMTFRRMYPLVALVLLSLLLVGCGTTPTEVTTESDDFLLALPQVVIDIDSNGSPSVAGADFELLKQMSFGALDLTWMRLDPIYTDWFTRSNVQHVEIVHKNDGLFLYTNGHPLPHVGWSGESLAATSDMVGSTGLLQPQITQLVEMALPFVQRTGVDVAIRFPVAAGAEVLPLRDPAAGAMMAQSEEGSIAQARVHVSYDTEGVPSVLSVSSKDLEDALGVQLLGSQLDPAWINYLMSLNVQHIMIRSAPDGLHLWMNGQALPHIAWSNEALENGADVYGQLYDTRAYTASREAAKMILPVLDNVDAEVVLSFPLAAGADPIALP